MTRDFLLFVALAGIAANAGTESSEIPARTRVERVPVAGGAELVTIFAIRPAEAGEATLGEEVPVVSVLRDTLENGSTARLRKVWVLTYARPTLPQRFAATFPFYSRTGSPSVSAHRPPPAILDLSTPQRNTFTGLLGAALQSQLFDSRGIVWRAPTRGYRSESSEYRSMHVAEAVEVLYSAENGATENAAFSPVEWDEINARLLLSRRLLGGLVSRPHALEMSDRQTRISEVNRGHNWEVLRQRAEKNGFSFEPLSFGNTTPSYAMLWISPDDFDANRAHPFDGSLLRITNPWTDERLRTWKGYRSPEGLIPLALYSLDYPPSPLILIDFRDEWKPKTWEIVGRTADYTATGVLGWTGFGNWGYLAAKSSWNFFRHRHGANVDRTTRVSAYAELRHTLFFDTTLDSPLRDLLANRLDHLALNPFERGKQEEMNIPRKQYAALLAYARDPMGLPAVLARDRGREMVGLEHGLAARTFMTAATVASLGLYRHAEANTSESLAQLERHRRLEADEEYLRKILASSPQLEVAWNPRDIQERLNEIAELKPEGRELDSGIATLVGRVYQQTRDDDIRKGSLACLAAIDSNGARRELQRAGQGDSTPATVSMPAMVSTLEQ